MFTRVDLPAPLRPTRAWDSPGSTASRPSARATVGPYRLTTSRASTSGVVSMGGVAIEPWL